MAIEIINEKPLQLTREQYERLNQEYQKAFMFYSGTVPSFETWARQKINEGLVEGQKLLTE